MNTSIKEFMPFFKRLTVQDFNSITYAMIKPDSTSAKEEMFRDIQEKGFEILFARDYQLSDQLAADFYSEHGPREDQPAKSFYPELCRQMTAGPVVVMILRKLRKSEDEPLAYTQWREAIGATNPAKAAKGSLRYKYTQVLFGGPEQYAEGKATNCFHGADSVASVIRESNLVLYDMYEAA